MNKLTKLIAAGALVTSFSWGATQTIVAPPAPEPQEVAMVSEYETDGGETETTESLNFAKIEY
jgi:hypothetical protein